MTYPPAPARKRLLALLFSILATTLLLCWFDRTADVAIAQDAAQPPDKAEKKEEVKTESKPAAKKKGSEGKNLFWHIVESAGPFFGPLLLLISVGLIWLIVMLSMDLRLITAIPPGFVEDFTDIVNKRNFKGAYDLAREDSSYIGRVLSAGMSRLQYGLEEAREASLNASESIKTSKKAMITYLATVGTLGPLLGLVGTVYGMILAFMELSSGDMDYGKLAAAISHALVVTLLGIALSVPAIFFHAFFTNRLSRVAMDTNNIADDLLTQMYHNSKKSGSGGPGVLPGAIEPTMSVPTLPPPLPPLAGDNRVAAATAKTK